MATSNRRGRAQRASAVLREARPRPLLASLPPRWRPTAVCSMPNRSHSSSVWAKSRAVTSHLVALRPHRVDHRPHDQHVGGVGQVDPDAHAATTSAAASSGRPRAHRQRQARCGRPPRCPAGRASRWRSGPSPAGGARARGSRRARPRRRSLSARHQLVRARVAGHVEVVDVLGAVDRLGQRHVLAEALRARRPPPPRGGPRSSRPARAAARAAPRPGARPGASCSPPPRTSACRRSRGSAAAGPAWPPRRRR